MRPSRIAIVAAVLLAAAACTDDPERGPMTRGTEANPADHPQPGKSSNAPAPPAQRNTARPRDPATPPATGYGHTPGPPSTYDRDGGVDGPALPPAPAP